MYFFQALYQKNPALFWFGMLCMLGAIICAILTTRTSIQVNNINAYIKPMKFFLSVSIYAFTMAWYCSYLNNFNTTLFNWAVIILLGFELVYIVLQAAKGQRSHYNLSTPFYSAMYSLMALAATLITLYTAYIGVLFFTNKFPELPTYYMWAIRLGIIIFVIFSFEGFVMGSRLSHTIGGADGSKGIWLLNWSKTLGDARVAHFMGMHSLQVIPLLSYYVLKNTKVIFILALLYFLLAAYTLINALKGKPFYKFRVEKNV